MPVNEFADMSKNLSLQIKVIEDLVKHKLFGEADALMSNATKCCHTLESLMVEDNKIQVHIIENRQKELTWIQDAISNSSSKTQKKSVVKRNSKIK